jgi:FkbM family methyltransferase
MTAMDAYGQEPEIRLLSILMRRLTYCNMLDIGAESGAVTQLMLDAGIDAVHAFEPHPDNACALHERFDGDARVKVHEYAVSDADGSGELYVSSTPEGLPLPFGHTLLKRDDTPEISWGETKTVSRRSLKSLIAAGVVPSRIGIVKIDTEGHDLAVIKGMGELEADVIMVEHWTDLPNGLGRCPWTPEQMIATLSDRGFSHFAFIIHRGEFVTLKWNDASVERGAMGNIVFVHDSALPRLLPDLLDCASRLGEDAASVGRMYMEAARDRLALIDRLEKVAIDRLALIERLAAGNEGETNAADLRAQGTRR